MTLYPFLSYICWNISFAVVLVLSPFLCWSEGTLESELYNFVDLLLVFPLSLACSLLVELFIGCS